MKINIQMYLLSTLFLLSCQNTPSTEQMNEWKAEIEQAERAFANLCKENGMAVAFVAFADQDAVLMRNNTLIIGREAIRSRFDAMGSIEGLLEWSPEFIEVSNAGDLAYTYGTYTYSFPDSLGNEIKDKGVFHTVWKRQPDGSWKYVWD